MRNCLHLALLVLTLSGCASQGVVENTSGVGADNAQAYSIKSFFEEWRTSDNALMLSFSGGGTRAAALSYGVMEELRDTPVVVAGRQKRLLDDIHMISSVSGGSFTSAYYGLHGDGLFDDFERVFLHQDVQSKLLRGFLNPFRWFSSKGRTEMAIKQYEYTVFADATFADMRKDDAPLILINASDLSTGTRFSFVQEYFNLLCSDLSTFPVARAVTASSAVPIVFEPVVVKNYPDCGSTARPWETAIVKKSKTDMEISQIYESLSQYSDPQKIQYAHLVDGGITDNLGLRAFYEIVEITGGITAMNKRAKRRPPRRIGVISVDASTSAATKLAHSKDPPPLSDAISAMSDVQLHRYNAATKELMERTIKKWGQQVSTPATPVETYFVQLSFADIKDPQELDFFNNIPTSFDLTNEQVERLIEAGRRLLRENPEFRRMLADMKLDES